MEIEFSEIASLIGDPVRAKVLWALLDRRAYTATELAVYADTTPPNISMHLGKLVKAGLLSVESQGRHKYYTYSRPDIAYAIEALANLLPGKQQLKKGEPKKQPIRYCRTCYDHLAGKVGVALMDGLVNKGFMLSTENSLDVTATGVEWLATLGIDVCVLKKQKRPLTRSCLDWSERRFHLAGSLGAALLNQMTRQGWLRPGENSRVMNLTSKGEQLFFENFDINLKELNYASSI